MYARTHSQLLGIDSSSTLHIDPGTSTFCFYNCPSPTTCSLRSRYAWGSHLPPEPGRKRPRQLSVLRGLRTTQRQPPTAEDTRRRPRAPGSAGEVWECFVSKAELSYSARERGRTRCRESSCTKSLLRGKYLGNFLATNGSAQLKRPLKTSLSHFLHPLLKCR